MYHSRSRYIPLTVIATASLGAVALAAGCQDSTPPTSPQVHAVAGHAASNEAAPVTGDIQRQIAQLRALTAQFHRFEAAVEAGWGTQITGCFEDPRLGGMGYHYGNTALIDG